MTRYVFRLKNTLEAPVDFECESIDEARNEAIRYLGRYLTDHPGFANAGHWQLDIENTVGQSLTHVIIATITPARHQFEAVSL